MLYFCKVRSLEVSVTLVLLTITSRFCFILFDGLLQKISSDQNSLFLACFVHKNLK